MMTMQEFDACEVHFSYNLATAKAEYFISSPTGQTYICYVPREDFFRYQNSMTRGSFWHYLVEHMQELNLEKLN